ncbi:lipase family protein [Paenibacillus pini]|uniref:Uncharacterized protein n=1 Tax=Paenibacillus pini JCM 16418 TaxID=1236976 RepID=W7Z282_9BACL|nr:lipase family protein [Paenibacillus pini]GAF08524.1 hypothetical protein JCM16418_2606 [Paenibacillus pini JCM 16418]
MSSNAVDDETYKIMSDLAYSDLKKDQELEELPGWKVLETPANNDQSGFDAVTFVNPDTNQAVIAYRGTEGSKELSESLPDFLNDGVIGINELGRKITQTGTVAPPWNDSIKKAEDFLGVTTFNNWMGDRGKDIDKATLGQNNQLYQSEDYANKMKDKYKELDFSLTGHSLGGGNAQYAAAYTGLTAVTFSAPSVIASLTPEARSKAEKGEFDSQIVNFVHPKDIVGSGTMGGFDLHVGSTYYINSNYEDANKGYSLLDKINNSFGGENYHSLNNYHFKDGYLSNDLYDAATGEFVSNSPRLTSSSHSFGGLSTLFGGMSHQLGLLATVVGSGKTIRVTPEQLKAIAEKWKLNAEQVNADMTRVRGRLAKYMHSSHSRRLQPIVIQLDQSITELNQWHLQQTLEYLNFINKKAEQFRQADSG